MKIQKDFTTTILIDYIWRSVINSSRLTPLWSREALWIHICLELIQLKNLLCVHFTVFRMKHICHMQFSVYHKKSCAPLHSSAVPSTSTRVVYLDVVATNWIVLGSRHCMAHLISSNYSGVLMWNNTKSWLFYPL